MLVAASTACYPELPLHEVLEKLADLEYAAVELYVGRGNSPINPDSLRTDMDSIAQTIRHSRRVTPVAIHLGIEPTDADFLDIFADACRLAKSIKVVIITVRASLRNAPFNEEVERLKELVKIGMAEGAIVGVLTEGTRITEETDAVLSLCGNVPGLSVTLDPSHFIFGNQKPKDYEQLLPYVNHVRLRDTTPETFQVQIGQGVLEFGRLAINLLKVGYKRALCVDMTSLPQIDFSAEMRKMRLLLESIL